MAIETRRERLPAGVFRLPVEKIRSGWYTDAYFNFTKELLEREGRQPDVTVQVFQKHRSVLGGIDEAIAVLRAQGAVIVDPANIPSVVATDPARAAHDERAHGLAVALLERLVLADVQRPGAEDEEDGENGDVGDFPVPDPGGDTPA